MKRICIKVKETIMIFILFALLFLSVSLLVIRLNSIDLSGCIFTLYYNQLIGYFPWIPSFLTFISESIRASDGSLDPIQNVLNLFGIVSFALTAINEISSTRSYGILLGDVIDHFFPFHKVFMIFLHGGFFLIGIYSCEKSIGSVACLSLIGLSLCLMYSFSMAWHFVFSEQAKKNRVYTYLSHMLGRGLSANKSAKKERHWNKNVKECILDYATYVGELWNRTSYQYSSIGKQSDELQLVKAVYAWLMGKPLKKIKERTITDCYLFADVFDQVFGLSSVCDDGQVISYGDYLLLTQCLRYDTPNKRTAFQDDIIKCSTVWENLFAQIENPYRQSQMVHAVLATAYKVDSQCFVLFACGLIMHTGILNYSCAEADPAKRIEGAFDFFRSISLANWEAQPTWKLDVQDGFLTAWCEMIYVVVGALLWSSAFGQYPSDIIESARRYARRGIVSASISDSLLSNLGKLHTLYSAYGYILFCATNVDVYKDISAYQLTSVYDDVMYQMRLGI